MHKLAVRLAVDFCVILLVAGGTALAQFQLSPGTCGSGTAQRWNGTAWTCETIPAGGLPAGAVVLIDSGTCPSGYAEDSALSGKTLFGTVAANSDVGTTGGADTITPAGAVAWPAGVPAFTGTSSTAIVNHVHIYTSQTATTGSASSYEHGAIDTSSTAAEASIPTNNPTGGVASYTPAGTIAWPAGTPAFTGTNFDNRSAFARVIFCKKS